MVFRLALSVLGREFAPEAEDVTQEVFLKVHHAIREFRGESEFRSWVYRIAFNRALNLKERVRFRSPHESGAALEALTSPGAGPEQRALEAERERVLQECIATLPEVYQSALRLYYWMDASVAEIAMLQGVPENTAKSYLHRARQLLHGMMTQRGGVPVSEPVEKDAAMDRMLRRSLNAPVPELSPDFESRVLREASRSEGASLRYRNAVLTGYAATSAIASVVVMRGQGLGWGVVALAMLTPMLLAAVGRFVAMRRQTA
jgi:RNA polymerase sigma-70 factor (ECF subfamily)